MVLEVTVATIPPPYTSQPGQPQEVPMTAMPVTGKRALSSLSFTFKVLIFTFTLQQLSEVALSRDVRQGDDGVSEHHRS